MYELRIEGHFAAAHNLRDYCGECEKLHGHNWRVVAEVAAEELNDLQMVMDFRDLKDTLQQVLSPLDHSYLNEVPPFDRLNPTTENLSRHVSQELARRLPEGIRVRRVSCWESDGCGASYVPQPG